MSQLLLDEPPMVVQRTLAFLIGLNPALMLQQIHYHAMLLDPDEDGNRWVVRTREEWRSFDFPFWSDSTIKRVITELYTKDLLVKLQSKNWNRTNRYLINYQVLNGMSDPMHRVKMTQWSGSNRTNASGQSDPFCLGQSDPMTLRKNSSSTPTHDDDDNPLGHWSMWDPTPIQQTQLKLAGVTYTEKDLINFRVYLSGLNQPPRSMPNSFKKFMAIESLPPAEREKAKNKIWKLSDNELMAECGKHEISTHGKSRQQLIDKLTAKLGESA